MTSVQASGNVLTEPTCGEPIDLVWTDTVPSDRWIDALAAAVPGQRLRIHAPDVRMDWAQQWLWSRVVRPAEPVVRWAVLATDLAPVSLARLLLLHDFADIKVALDPDPAWEQTPLLATARLASPGTTRHCFEEQLSALLDGIDPLDPTEAVWIGDEAMAAIEFLGDQIDTDAQSSLLALLSDANVNISVCHRIASVLGPDPLVNREGAVEVISRLVHSKPTRLGFRVMAQLGPYIPPDLHEEMATILLKQWMSISHPPWIGYQGDLLLATLATPLSVLRSLENCAAALLRGGHPVTSASLNTLFTTLEMIYPALMPTRSSCE